MKQSKLVLAVALIFGSLLASVPAHAQLIFNFDYGVQHTAYGSSRVSTSSSASGKYNNGSYSQTAVNTGYVGVGLGFLFAGHSGRKFGYNTYVIGDAQFPSNTELDFGGITSGGAVIGENFRIHQVAFGAGFDIHEYKMASDPNIGNPYPQRPNEMLIAVPVLAKYSFGPGARAYVQGGFAFDVSNSPGNYTDNSSANTAGTALDSGDLKLAKGKLSTDTKVAAGYAFGRWGVRANYLFRDVYLDHTGTIIPSTTPATYFDWHEQTFSAGITYTAF
jgi:hypothetical protein